VEVRKQMNVTKLTVNNIGCVGKVEIVFDFALNLFYGEVMSGKTTLLNAVRWSFGGAFPDDIIQHGKREAFVQLEGTEENKPWVIRREWYVGKDGTTKARSISFTRNGVPSRKPVDEIARFLNPFLLNQDHLRDMTELQRGRYLAELFGVDTAEEDRAINAASVEAAELRAKVKGYGEIDLTPVSPVDVDALRLARAAIVNTAISKAADAKDARRKVLTEFNEAAEKIETHNIGVRIANGARDKAAASVDALTDTIAGIESRIVALQEELKDANTSKNTRIKWLSEHPAQDELPRPSAPDTSEYQAIIEAKPDTFDVDCQIAEAGATNVKAKQYQANKARAEAKAADERRVLELEAEQRRLKDAKVAKLAGIGAASKVPGLVFKESGGFEYEGTDAGMLSDSQIMRLSQGLSALYPAGFGLSLIDRGESLGKSVMQLQGEAEARESTILVTIVG
jgi:DNA repair exonuclease SbcCD ATPase subunit